MWNFSFVPPSKIPKNYGECDAPYKINKGIRINNTLRHKDLITIILHEAIHAANWHLDEEFVEEFSQDLGRALTRPEIWEKILDTSKPNEI